MDKHLKILLLEDAPEDVSLIERELQKAEMAFTFLVVKKKDEFERALREFEPDVILCDHALPQFNSIEAFDIFGRYRQERGTFVPFILVTGNVSEEFAIRMLKAGVDDYILKTALKRLPSAIESALAKCRAENEGLKYHNRILRIKQLMSEAEQLAHFGSWDVDVATRQYTWSDENYRIYGYEPGEVEPSYELYLSLVHPDDLDQIKAMQAKAQEKLDAEDFEFRIIDRHGKLKYLRNRFIVRRDEQGRAVRITGFSMDVTERVLAAQSLRVNEQVYRSLFDENPDVVFSVDTEGRFTKVNAAFATMVGYTIDDLRGTDFRRVLHKSELERVYPYLLSALGRKPQRYRTNFVNKNGKKTSLDVTVMPIVVDKEVVGVHCIAKDLTKVVRVGRGSAAA